VKQELKGLLRFISAVIFYILSTGHVLFFQDPLGRLKYYVQMYGYVEYIEKYIVYILYLIFCLLISP